MELQQAMSVKTPRWIRRFIIIFGVAFVVIAGAQLLRGRTVQVAALHGFIWSAISATIFVVAQIRRERKLQRCAVCDVIDASTSKGSGSI